MSTHNFVPQDDYNVRLCAICGLSKSQCLAAKEETLEEIAERIMLPAVGKVAPAIWNAMVYDCLSALRNERERAAKIAETHLSDYRNNLSASSVAAAIRGRTE